MDVTSEDFRCYTSETDATASTVTVAAGSVLGIECDITIYHPGVSSDCHIRTSLLNISFTRLSMYTWRKPPAMPHLLTALEMCGSRYGASYIKQALCIFKYHAGLRDLSRDGWWYIYHLPGTE